MKNPCLEAALCELRAAGIRDIEQARGGKHIQIRWQINGNLVRVYTMPATPSDYRAPHNVRAAIRRILKQDGVLTSPPPAAAPKKPDRFTQLERRVAALEQAMRKVCQ